MDIWVEGLSQTFFGESKHISVLFVKMFYVGKWCMRGYKIMPTVYRRGNTNILLWDGGCKYM